MDEIPELEKITEIERGDSQKYKFKICVCNAGGCISSNSSQVYENLKSQIINKELSTLCKVIQGGCLGLCAQGPLVIIHPRNIIYKNVKPDDAEEIIENLGKNPVQRLLCKEEEQPFFNEQMKLILRRSGLINPENISEYIREGGYYSLLKVLNTMKPIDVIQEISNSGLRGRGGAGYPTGLKWQTVAKAEGVTKYVICNADEGDPGAFMNQTLLASDPHSVIEGMIIAGYAIGASKGYIYVRAEYPLAATRLQKAIPQAKKQGLLGTNILHTTFNFDIELRLGAGAYVCGEETALIASIEGKRGTPRPRPPYPAQSGLWGCPTLINNVETYANVPLIIEKGSKWYSNIGSDNSKGTKIFALAGCVKNNGLIEIPYGIPLKKVIFEIGGGMIDGRKFKAVQTGGPSGGCIPEKYLDIPIDYESLINIGSTMGSGGMIVIDESSCMVDIAKYFMEFCKAESCGKCVPCRVGTAQLYQILKRITSGQGVIEDLDLLEELCDFVKNTSLCGLGQNAPNPILTTLKYFKDEYLAHIIDKKCLAGVCKIKNV